MGCSKSKTEEPATSSPKSPICTGKTDLCRLKTAEKAVSGTLRPCQCVSVPAQVACYPVRSADLSPAPNTLTPLHSSVKSGFAQKATCTSAANCANSGLYPVQASIPADLPIKVEQNASRPHKSTPSTTISTIFSSLNCYKRHFAALLHLERLAHAKSIQSQLTPASLRYEHPLGKQHIYSITLKNIDDFHYGDQFRLSGPNPAYQSDLADVHSIEEGMRRLELRGRLIGAVRVEYYRSLPMRRMQEGLENCREDHPLLKLLMGESAGGNRDWEGGNYVPTAGVRLDDSQKEAISSALNSRLTLILGPPGSGKTSVAAELVVQLCRKRGKVLVCAPSNVAADNLAVRLKEREVRVLRFYSKSSEYKVNKADEFALHTLIFTRACQSFPTKATLLHALPYKSRNEMKSIIGPKPLLALEKRVLGEFQVICCTCSSAADRSLAHFLFDSLLIDEAAFCSEPEALIPIVASNCKKLVLIGDPKQLRPIITCDEAKNNGLEISLFERLQTAGMNTQWLEVQYRMHPDISYYPRTRFYDGRLKDGITAGNRSLKGKAVNQFFQGNSLLFAHSPGQELPYKNTKSRWNPKEAEMTISVLERLIALQVPLTSIGVITFYEGQRQTLIKRAKERLHLSEKDIEIKNVDGYQGREKDFIVISCVRTGSEGLGFLASTNRVNVALTRAKYGLVVVGNRKTVKKAWPGFLRGVAEVV